MIQMRQSMIYINVNEISVSPTQYPAWCQTSLPQALTTTLAPQGVLSRAVTSQLAIDAFDVELARMVCKVY